MASSLAMLQKGPAHKFNLLFSGKNTICQGAFNTKFLHPFLIAW